jgi:uncharacterized membrane protein YidH (DUF202 family)
MDEQKPDSSNLAQLNTIMAYNRTRAASERTLMAWIRTSMAMISFGFSISAFFRSLLKIEGLSHLKFATEPTILGLVLVFLGTTILAVGAIQEYLFLREIYELMKPLKTRGPWTFSLSFAGVMIIIGVVVFAYMVYNSLQ